MNTSGILALASGMRAYFQQTGAAGVVVATVGWNQRPQLLNQGKPGANRVLLIPGKQPGGEAAAGGALTRDSRPSTTNPRALLTWRKDVTMSVWAADADPKKLRDEEAQLAAVENLLELAIRAAHSAVDPNTGRNVGLAAIEWGAVRYTVPPAEMAYGREILVEFVHKCPIFDATADVATPQFAITGRDLTTAVTQ